MTRTMIDYLTSEQKKLVYYYYDKWKKITFSTEPIDCKKAIEVCKAAYRRAALEEPEIIFCESPYAALKNAFVKPISDILLSRPKRQMTGIVCKKIIGRKLGSPMRKKFGYLYAFKNHGGISKIRKQVGRELYYQVMDLYVSLERGEPGGCLERGELGGLSSRYSQLRKLFVEMENQLPRDLLDNFDRKLADSKWISTIIEMIAWGPLVSFNPLGWFRTARELDYYYSVFNCPHSQKRWEIFSGLAEFCSWSFLYEKKCVLCDRPRILSFDSKNRLHGEGEPAIQFTDGYSLYAYHGVIIPGKYGKIPSSQWKGKWLLEEADPRLKQVLVHGLGGYEPSFEESE